MPVVVRTGSAVLCPQKAVAKCIDHLQVLKQLKCEELTKPTGNTMRQQSLGGGTSLVTLMYHYKPEEMLLFLLCSNREEITDAQEKYCATCRTMLKPHKTNQRNLTPLHNFQNPKLSNLLMTDFKTIFSFFTLGLFSVNIITFKYIIAYYLSNNIMFFLYSKVLVPVLFHINIFIRFLEPLTPD